MANESNLKPFTNEQSREEAMKNGQAGGIASGESRREKRQMRKILSDLLENYAVNGENTKESIALALIEQAKKGNIKAFDTIMKFIGDAPEGEFVLGF